VLLEIEREAMQLWKQALVTGLEALKGFLLALALAYPWTTIEAMSTRARAISAPLFSLMQRIPLLALAPLLLLWFGYGAIPAVALAFLACFLPLLRSIQAGFESVSIEVLEIVKSMGAGPATIFLKVRFPASLPFAIHGLKTAIPFALSGAVVAEFIGSDEGLGNLMLDASSKMDATRLLAALAVLILLALSARCLIALAERAWITWPSFEPGQAELSSGDRSDMTMAGSAK
jgi:NitT/TauT family transport system permease protein